MRATLLVGDALTGDQQLEFPAAFFAAVFIDRHRGLSPHSISVQSGRPKQHQLASSPTATR